MARPGRAGTPSKNVYQTGQNLTLGAYEFVIEQKNAVMWTKRECFPDRWDGTAIAS